MSAKSKQLLLVGLPAAGKTSFLAALWYMVDQSVIPCKLTLDKIDGDRKYLNEIRDAWANYKPVPRTLVDKVNQVSMILRHRDTNLTTRLSFPDLSGEAFLLQWTKRQLSHSYEKQLRGASGALLFVHPFRLIKPHRIDEVAEGTALVKKFLPGGAPAPTTPPKEKEWEPEKSPTQVQLIELLQIIVSRETFQAPFRLAIVVSAFDLAAGSMLTPAAFLARELPMLQQYLDANSHLLECTCYGISAQGAEYRSPELTAAMIKDPAELKKRIAGGQEPVCLWLREQLDEPTKAAVADTAAQPNLKELLASGLNALLAKGELYDAERFAAVTLREDTRYLLEALLLKDSRERTEVMAVNRMLLEDAFPAELSRDWKNDAQHFELAKRHPAERVSVVGTDVQNERDITEPIQWLMR